MFGGAQIFAQQVILDLLKIISGLFLFFRNALVRLEIFVQSIALILAHFRVQKILVKLATLVRLYFVGILSLFLVKQELFSLIAYLRAIDFLFRLNI